MASFLRRQDDLQNLKTRNLYLQNSDGTYPADQSVLTISGTRGRVATSTGITVQSLSTCALTASEGRFNVSCPTGWVDMYPPGLTSGSIFGTYASSGIQLHGGITGGTTTNMWIFRNYIQAQPNDLSGAGVPLRSIVGIIGIANENGGFRAPIMVFDGSANKMRIIQYNDGGPKYASVTIDNNYELEPLPLNQTQHVGRVNAQQIQVAGYMGVNVYDNSGGFLPIQPFGVTQEFGGACLRNSPTSNATPYNPAANTNRFPTIVTAWKPTTGTPASLNYNLLTMDVSNGFIGIRNNTPTYTMDVSGNLNIRGNFTASGTKAFAITHPIDSTKRLVFSCIEGPRNDLIYRGQAKLTDGIATVSLDSESTANGIGMTPGTFSALARNPQVYLQNNTAFDRVIGTVAGNILTIRSESADSTATIDWMVVAERKDPYMYQAPYNDKDTGYLINEHPDA